MMKFYLCLFFLYIYNVSIAQQEISIANTKQQTDDYEFSLEQYSDFLEKLKQNPNIVFVLQKDLDDYSDTSKIVVSIRHDVDADIYTAMNMAKIESNLDIFVTYFILHTAYYYHPSGDFSTHNNTILEKMQYIQELGHEIGIHNDLLSLQLAYNISPTDFLHNELQWMRENGLKIYGSASHGSNFCSKYHYLNYYFFRYCSDNHYSEFYYNHDSVVIDNETIWFEKADFSDFDFTYESYFLDYTKYYSDVIYSNGERFNPTKIDISKWKLGDRILILVHPTHWQINNSSELVVYPNPCNNYFNVYIEELDAGPMILIEIFDINGNLVQKDKKIE